LRGHNGEKSPKTESGLQNQYHVIHTSIGNIIWNKQKYTFRGKKGENKFSEPKNGIWASKSVWLCDISIDRKFYMEQAKIYFEDHNVKISHQSPKTEFGVQNQNGRVINRKFYMEQAKTYFFGSTWWY
jgi:hypothetical protein